MDIMYKSESALIDISITLYMFSCRVCVASHTLRLVSTSRRGATGCKCDATLFIYILRSAVLYGMKTWKYYNDMSVRC